MTERRVVDPGEVDLESPGRRDYWVRFDHDSSASAHLVPLSVFVGRDAPVGTGLLVVGATHGDEYEGPVAIRNLLVEFDPAWVTGRLVLIPVLNASAFHAGRRETPDDGLNLNRVFPGSEGGRFTERLAAFVTGGLFPHVDAVMDLHAGGRSLRFAPQVHLLYVDDEAHRARMVEQARSHATPFIVFDRATSDRLLRSTAIAMGLTHSGGEFGWGEAVQADGVAMARRGILSTGVARGVLIDDLEPTDRTSVRPLLLDASDSASYLSASGSGVFEPTVPLGSTVGQGDHVGRLHDFERVDEAATDIRAPFDGVVTCQAWNATVRQGDWLTVIARHVDA